MSLSHISYNMKLTFRVTLIYHQSSIKRGNNQQAMLLKEYETYNCFVFILVVKTRLNFLKKLSSLTAVLSYKSSCVTNEEFSSLVAEFTRCYVGLKAALSQLSENFLQTASDIVVHSYIVRTKQEDSIC